ncbi:hypothetical protein GCM10011415_02150 [Salipiger pallidus]|uniref:Uncharacterized protein n=1 Tax=Salipiger pallidus TaxID=1775170 RepID=A0A8J2ZGC3_9RHOB|nr:hypothetical protein [Salipiger pallidus]GGG59786.1 hypothetical protein GCM10011415_02150 [Salipiger pallidus]
MTRKKPAAADVAVTLGAAAEIASRPGRKRHLPAGWSGALPPADRDALAARGALVEETAPAAAPEITDASEE